MTMARTACISFLVLCCAQACEKQGDSGNESTQGLTVAESGESESGSTGADACMPANVVASDSGPTWTDPVDGCPGPPSADGTCPTGCLPLQGLLVETRNCGGGEPPNLGVLWCVPNNECPGDGAVLVQHGETEECFQACLGIPPGYGVPRDCDCCKLPQR